MSSTTSGICLAMISDHKGSPVTGISASQHTLHVRHAHTYACTHTVLVYSSYPAVQLPSCGPQPVQIWMVSSQDGRHSIWGSRWLENIHVLVDWLAHPTTGQPSVSLGALSTPTHPCWYPVPPTHPSPVLLQVARFSPLDADLVLYTAPGGSDSAASVLNTYSISHRKVR